MGASLLTTLITSLTPAALSGVFNLHSTATNDIEGLLSTMQFASDNPLEVAACADKIIQVSGCPLQVQIMALKLKQNSSNPVLVLAYIAQMQSYLNMQSSNILSQLATAVTGS